MSASHEVAVRPPVLPAEADVVQVINPTTGEVLDLATADDRQLAEWRAAVIDWKRNADQAIGHVDAEIVRRMDARNDHTIRVEGFKLSAPASADKVEYDGEALFNALWVLAASGEVDLEPDAVRAAVKLETVHKPVASKIAGLLKRGGVIAETIQEHARTIPVARRVKVDRA